MPATLQDRQDIEDLMTGWMHRDLGEWERLRDLFHPEAHIEITWFEGLAFDFVDASAKMAISDLRTKHVIAAPVVTFSADGLRAFSETNAIIVAENVRLAVGCNGHGRFIDQLERRVSGWKIVDRKSVYDFAFFTFPSGIVKIDRSALARHPREYSALAYLLDASGFPVRSVFATKGSELELGIKAAADRWITD